MSEILGETQMLALMKRHLLWLQIDQDADQSTDGKLSLRETILSDMTISAQDLTCAEFGRCQFNNVTFTQCNLTAAILIDSVFRNCRFLACSLYKADLRSAHCNSVDFTGSDLTRADLTDADLSYANLTNCLLNWAWLIDTDLRHAILDRTELEGARLAGTKLYNSQKYTPGTLERILIEDVDVSPQGNGDKYSGIEAIEFLWKK